MQNHLQGCSYCGSLLASLRHLPQASRKNLCWNSWRSGDLKHCFRLQHKGLMTDLSCLFSHLQPQAKGQRVSTLIIM